MHVPRELYPIERALAEHLPHLRGPQRRGLALWVLGAVLAQSACQAAVLAALLPWAPYHALRQRLREWLLDGADKAGPLRRAGRRRALLRAPAAAGAGLVAGARAGAGGRRDRPPRGRGGAGGQRALPRLGDPGRLGGPARQRAGAVAGHHPPLAAPAAAGRAAGLDGARSG